MHVPIVCENKLEGVIGKENIIPFYYVYYTFYPALLVAFVNIQSLCAVYQFATYSKQGIVF